MEENFNALPVTSKTAGIRYGVILGIVLILCFLIIAITSMDINGPAKWANYFLFVIFIFLAHRYYKEHNSYMEYGTGIGIGFWVSLLSSVISSVFIYLYIRFVDTDYINLLKSMQIDELHRQGMNEQGMQQATKIFDVMMQPEVFAAMGLVVGFFGAIILAFIVSIFTQRKAPQQAF